MTTTVLAGSLRVECALLLRLARLHLNDEDQDAVRQRLEQDGDQIDWGNFLDQACRHRVLPLVAYNLSRHNLHRHSADGHFIVPYWWLFDGAVRANRERNTVLGEEYGRVIQALTQSGVPHAVRKGPALAERLYPDPGLRITRDLDLLVAKEDFGVVAECLHELGYAQGRATTGARIEPYTRATQVFWETFLPNRLPFVKPGVYAGLDWYVVDPMVGLLPTGVGHDLDVPTVLARTRRDWLYGAYGHLLGWADWLLDLSVHVYEEAVSRHYIRRGKDLRLQKFLDLAAVCGAMPATAQDEFTALVDEHGAGAEVYYALNYTARLFPGAVPAEVLAALRPEDTGYLEEYGALDKASGRWQEPFLERLFNPHRGRQVAGESPIPTR